ncbi:MAG: hypothetical protein J7K40_02495 [candidate division Zixibacteria bacterium]|nr:hypothetical protein [candidate division Zixibacteria bacterium]
MIKAILIAVLLLGIGVILLILFLLRLIRRLSFNASEGKAKTIPGSVSYWAIFLATILFIISWLFFWSANQLKSFHSYEPSNVIGYIEVKQKGDLVKSMEINYYPFQEGVLSTPTTFYLSGNSWKIQGQYINLSNYLTLIFNGPDYCKISEFLSDYKGHKPPGADAPILNTQHIKGGAVDLESFSGIFGLAKGVSKVGEFESEFIMLKRFGKYWIVLSDSGIVSLETKAPLYKQ